MNQRTYDSTVARIAGNLLSGVWQSGMFNSTTLRHDLVVAAVAMARDIVAETKRTEPPKEGPC